MTENHPLLQNFQAQAVQQKQMLSDNTAELLNLVKERHQQRQQALRAMHQRGLLGSGLRASYDNGVPFEHLQPEQRIKRLKEMFEHDQIDLEEFSNGVDAALQLKTDPYP